MKTAQQVDDNYDSQSESDTPIIPQKWKAATDHKNSAFEENLKMRTIAKSSNYLRENRESLKTMSHGKLPQARIDVPDGFEVHPYAN